MCDPFLLAMGKLPVTPARGMVIGGCGSMWVTCLAFPPVAAPKRLGASDHPLEETLWKILWFSWTNDLSGSFTCLLHIERENHP